MIQDKTKLLGYIKQAVRELVEAGQFPNGWAFKPTQAEALDAFDVFLDRTDLTDDEKLIGFFDIPTGVGKTGLFSGIVGIAYRLAAEKNDTFTSMIVVPTNDLVDQTYAEMIKICPFLKGMIGLYDYKRKELGQPITIITYDSWTTLLESGQISAQNTDLLISDEGHRGTSERRTENIFEAYDHQENHWTARLAVTATSQFDEEKTVEQTHKHKIYDRRIADSVRIGELAAYISTQFYKIRVNPDEEVPNDTLSDEFEGSAQNGKHQAMRRAAWNKRMLVLFRDGRDSVPITKDLLWDNQAGFFVSNTRHADAVMELFNNDPVLKARAEKEGLIAPVIAIHSNMKESLQKKRKEDYLAGKYRAVVGDQKFKEGFDHPPMKTIFDYPRGSLVDKGQILGRAARKWFNEAKDRYEGMTFIDSIVYVGSNDPKEDQKLHDRALVQAIRARDILEENYVLGPGIKKPKQTTKTTPGGTGLFEDDPDVTEYSSLEDLHLIETEKQEILTRVQPISEEDQAKMKAEAKRTGLGGSALFKHIENPPDELNGVKANHIISGNQKSAPPSWVRSILDTYSQQPDAVIAEEYKKIAEKDRIKIQEEAKRTGLMGGALFNRMKDPLKKLNTSKVNDIVAGRTKSAPPSWIIAILEEYRKQPDAEVTEKYEKISKEDRLEIQKKVEETGVKGKALFKQMKNPPKGLTADNIGTIISGKQKYVLGSWIKAILEEYDRQILNYIEKTEIISKKNILLFKKEEKRTGLGGNGLFKHIKDPPPNLNAGKTGSIVSGRTKSAPPSWVIAILETYRKQPDATITEKHKKISEKDRIKLQKKAKKTGVAGYGLFTRIQNPPEGLSRALVKGIVSGKTKSARPSHLKAIFDTYAFLLGEEVDAESSATQDDADMSEKLVFDG